MRINLLVVLAAFLVTSAPANAEVVSAAANGFKVVSISVIDSRRDEAWQRALNDVDKWWSSDHTVSGEASRLRIEARPRGCFCEDLGKDAGVVHMTVTMISPPTILRLTGGLGPLGLMGVSGNMTWEFDDAGDSTQVTFTYAVGGHHADGLDGLAKPVDGVIEDALLRLKAYVETGDAEHATLE